MTRTVWHVTRELWDGADLEPRSCRYAGCPLYRLPIYWDDLRITVLELARLWYDQGYTGQEIRYMLAERLAHDDHVICAHEEYAEALDMLADSGDDAERASRVYP